MFHSSGKACFVTVMFCLTEISTPFVNGRWFLSELKMKDGFLYIANGLCILVFFGTVRMAFIVIYYVRIVQQWDDFMKHSAYMILCVSLMANAIHTLNLYWFYKIFTGFLALLKKDDHKKK